MTDTQKAREFFAKDIYATSTTGIEIDEVNENYVKCSLKLDERHMNAVGHVMGGVIFTLADFVFAVATNYNKPTTVTAVSQISYFDSPKGDILYGESKLLKDGRRNCFYEISITDNFGTNVAMVTTSGVHIGA